MFLSTHPSKMFHIFKTFSDSSLRLSSKFVAKQRNKQRISLMWWKKEGGKVDTNNGKQPFFFS